MILSDEGKSSWGWKQNALIRVDSKTDYYVYTRILCGEAFFVIRLFQVQGFYNIKRRGRIICLLLLSLTPEGKYLIVAGNYGDVAQQMTVQLGGEVFKCNFTGALF